MSHLPPSGRNLSSLHQRQKQCDICSVFHSTTHGAYQRHRTACLQASQRQKLQRLQIVHDQALRELRLARSTQHLPANQPSTSSIAYSGPRELQERVAPFNSPEGAIRFFRSSVSEYPIYRMMTGAQRSILSMPIHSFMGNHAMILFFYLTWSRGSWVLPG